MKLSKKEFDGLCAFARSDLLGYACLMYNRYVPAEHHKLMAEALQKVESGEVTRLMLSLPPRHGKTMLTSEFFPSWYLGRNPTKQVIIASATGDYAGEIGGKVRNLMQDDIYKFVFPDVSLRKDSKAKDKFNTNKGGTVIARGMNGQITGRGAHLLIIDDPIKSWQEADSNTVRKNLKTWYSGTAYHRLMPGNSAIIIINTRWHSDDLTGWLLEEHGHENWTELKLPAINKMGAPLWPDAYNLDALNRIKKTLTRREWTALYQQEPTDEEGNILKRTDWVQWPANKSFPTIEYVIQSYDTAFSDKDVDTASRSARTTWGVFNRNDGTKGVMLLEAWADRVDYPTLKDNFVKSYKEWKPDRVIIEKKASGQSLIQDLRRAGIPVTAYNPDRDKVARAYAVQALLEAKLVHKPNREWADEVVEELAKFPTGKTDDYVDTATQAWLFLRNTGMLQVTSDWSAWDIDRKQLEKHVEEEEEQSNVVFIGNWKTKKNRKLPAYG